MNDKYSSAIDFLSKNKIDFIFPNSNTAHAAIVFSAIFNSSKKVVRIFVNHLNGDISNEEGLLPAMEKHVNNGKKLLIIVNRKRGNESPVREKLKFLSINKPSLVQIKEANKEFTEKMGSATTYYFSTGDSSMYRLEKDNTKHEAICNFNDEKTTKELNSIFDTYYPTLENYF